MHRQKVSLAIEVPRPWDWFGVWAGVNIAETEARRQQIDDVTWSVLFPDSIWVTHLSSRHVAHYFANPTVALIGEGWAWKD